MKRQYEDNKKQTISEFDAFKKQCDFVYEGNATYKKILDELEHVYYCEALTLLKDFDNKRKKSKAMKAHLWNARRLQYNENRIGCD